MEYSNLTVSELLSHLGWKLSAKTFFSVNYREQTLPFSLFDQVKTQNGNCALFRSNSSIVQQLQGSENGLEIYMNIETDYIPSFSANETDDLTSPTGIDVFVYDSNLSHVV